jgi:hypothetical protein
MRLVQEPLVSDLDGPIGGMQYEHPAFGQISASRINGREVLYGSDFVHHACVRVRIATSVLRRDLSHDWPYSDRPFIEVDLSEAQWATFVSSMNVGGGVQCTIRSRDGLMVPEMPDPISHHEQFKGESSKRMTDAVTTLDELITQIQNSGLSKVKQAELLRNAQYARANISGNQEFVAKSFGEHMERTKEAAKVEVNAYLIGAVTRAGLQALGGNTTPILEIPRIAPAAE